MCIFLLNADLLSLGKEFRAAHACGKRVFVHMDLARGVGKDKEGVQVLKSIGADGMISTRTSLLKQAKEWRPAYSAARVYYGFPCGGHCRAGG